MDLLTVLEHEIGHLLGHDHDDAGVMAETLAAGVRQTDLQRDHVALTDEIFKRSGDHRADAWLGAAFAEPLESTRLGGKRRR